MKIPAVVSTGEAPTTTFLSLGGGGAFGFSPDFSPDFSSDLSSGFPHASATVQTSDNETASAARPPALLLLIVRLLTARPAEPRAPCAWDRPLRATVRRS